jgi:nucleotide-binding universal stress UspA family protein
MISPAAALLVGSTTLAVGAHATCPVVAWRGAAAVTDAPVVLGVDGTNTGAAAFAAAFDFADRVGAGVKAVHAWAHFAPRAGVTNPLLIDWDGLEALQWQGLMAQMEPWCDRYPRVPVTHFVEPSGAADALLRHAADAQLVVVGSRRRNALAGALLGSTSLNLLHHCRVPVMLCHPQQ